MSSPLNPALQRRSFLKGIGATIALPFLESVPLSAATPSAATGPTAKRLVCFGVTLGMHPESWVPQTTGTNYNLSPLLQPLA